MKASELRDLAAAHDRMAAERGPLDRDWHERNATALREYADEKERTSSEAQKMERGVTDEVVMIAGDAYFDKCRHDCYESGMRAAIEAVWRKPLQQSEDDMRTEQITPEQALKALSDAMNADPDYAWGWHCNLAMMAVDAGAPHKEANEGAAGFMWLTFGVPTHNMIPERTSAAS